MPIRCVCRCMLLCLIAAGNMNRAIAKVRPDVFLITIDTIRADHVGCYGYDRVRTPALDRLATDGYRFKNAFSTSPITNASHASILTGDYPSVHGVTGFGVPLSRAHRTVAEMLKSSGYRTAAFIGSVVLDSAQLAPGFDRGFDSYDHFPEHARSRSRWNRLERRADVVEKHVETWLRANPAGPRFVWMHLYDPHDPYEPPAPFAGRYRDRPYDGEIAYADHAVGQLLRFLKLHGNYESSLIVVVGDHGEGLGEHGEATHGLFLYDSTIHVPLIVKMPHDGRRGEIVATQVRTVDIVPTVLEVTGTLATAGPTLDGESLVPLFSTHRVDRWAVAATDYPLQFEWAPLRALRTPEFKYIEAPRPELYNVKKDPHETRNVYEPWNSNVEVLRAELRKTEEKHDPAAAVSSNTVAELRALGYLGSEGGSTTAAEPWLLPDPKDKIEISNLLHFALMRAENGDTASALTALRSALAIDADSPAVLSQLGEVELSLRQYGPAAEHLHKAAERRPHDATALKREGEALEQLGRVQAAREAFESSIKLAPAEFDVRKRLAKIYLSEGMRDAAIDQLEAAVLLRPNDVEARVTFARALLANNDFAEAARQLEQATRAAPTSENLSLLRRAYEGAGQTDLARAVERREARLRERRR